MVAKEKGAVLRVIPVNDRGEVMLEEYQALLGPRTKARRADACLEQPGHDPAGRRNDADGQALQRPRADRRSPVDRPLPGQRAATGLRLLRLFGAQDFRARPASGVVYAKQELLEIMPPWQGGGNMIRDVTFEETTYNEPPAQFRGGHAQHRRRRRAGARRSITSTGWACQHRQVRARTAAVRDRKALSNQRAAADRHGPRKSRRALVRPPRATHRRRRPPARSGRDRRSRRASLCAAVATPVRIGSDRPPVVVALQHQGRSRPAGRRNPANPSRLNGAIHSAAAVHATTYCTTPRRRTSRYPGSKASWPTAFPCRRCQSPRRIPAPHPRTPTIRKTRDGPKCPRSRRGAPAHRRQSAPAVPARWRCLPRTTGSPWATQACVPPSTFTTS